MTASDFNPYEAPTERMEDVPPQELGDGEFRVEKKALVFCPPCRLPRICFVSGQETGLTDCEFTIRVMPRWWQWVIPISIFVLQISVAPIMGSVLPLLKLQPNGTTGVMLGVFIGGGIPGTVILLLIVAAHRLGRKIPVFACYSEEGLQKARRKSWRIVKLVGIVMAVVAGIAWYLTGFYLPILFISLPVFAVMCATLYRIRKPWSQIGGLLTKDDTIALYGLSAVFLTKCRLLKTMPFSDMDAGR